jgi:hypothetical protein
VEFTTVKELTADPFTVTPVTAAEKLVPDMVIVPPAHTDAGEKESIDGGQFAVPDQVPELNGYQFETNVAPVPLKTEIYLSSGYDPPAFILTEIVAPVGALNVAAIGPNPVVNVEPIVVTTVPFTETFIVPPFHPSPYESYI